MRFRELAGPPLYACLSAWRAAARHTAPPAAFRILLLHDVPPDRYNSLGAFLDHVDTHHGFISPDEAIGRLDGNAFSDSRRVPCLLTFDDGFAGNRNLVEAVLRPRGIRALFFVCPGLIDLDDAGQKRAVLSRLHAGRVSPASLPDGRVLMSWDDLAFLMENGHSIGAHTMNHRRLTGISKEVLEEEIAGSRTRIAGRLGRAPDWFAFPFGDIGSIDSTALAVVGRYFRICRSGIRGLNRPGGSRLAVFADHVDPSAGLGWQRLVAAGGLDFFYRDARERLIAMARDAAHNAAP